MKKLLMFVALSILAGCGSGISGAYGGQGCKPYEKFTFKNDGTVYIAILGSEVPGKYVVDGDRVSVSVPGRPGIVFLNKGGALATSILGQKIVCNKL